MNTLTPEECEQLINLSDQSHRWYYFTVDLDFEGFASVKFVRYVEVNGDRTGAVVELLDQDYFRTRRLLLLPTTREADGFRTSPDGLISVWTFDASAIREAVMVDVQTDWPHNILDKAAITSSIATAQKWTQRTP